MWGTRICPRRRRASCSGTGRLVGVTVRDAAGARAAKEAGADYVGVGPVFGTTTKQVAAPVLGLEGFRGGGADSPLPVVGIGGVRLANIAQVAAAGAHGGAVVSDALLAEDIAERVRRLLAAFDTGVRGTSPRERSMTSSSETPRPAAAPARTSASPRTGPELARRPLRALRAEGLVRGRGAAGGRAAVRAAVHGRSPRAWRRTWIASRGCSSPAARSTFPPRPTARRRARAWGR